MVVRAVVEWMALVDLAAVRLLLRRLPLLPHLVLRRRRHRRITRTVAPR
jgi:hypothetical protein